MIRLKEPDLLEQFEPLRVLVETTLTMPATLLVSSARQGDGSGVAASALSSSLQLAGYSTLLVEHIDVAANAAVPAHSVTLEEVAASGIGKYTLCSTPSYVSNLTVISRTALRTVSRDAVATFFLACKQSYQFTVISTSCLASNPFGLLALDSADSVLLTVREGRRVVNEDKRVAKLLSGEETRFLGVVAVSRSAIRTAPFNSGSRKRLAAFVPKSKHEATSKQHAV